MTMRPLLAATVVTAAFAACHRAPSHSLGPDQGKLSNGIAATPSASSTVRVAATAPVDAGGTPADAAAAPLYAPRAIPLVTTNGIVRLGTDAGFPAVNREGTEVVLLAHDSVDFIGAALEHVVFLDTTSARRTRDTMIYDELGERDRTPSQLAEAHRKGAASVLETSEHLRRTTWRTLEPSRSNDEPATGAWLPLAAARADVGATAYVRFGTDLDVELPENAASDAMIALTVRRLREGRVVPSALRMRVPRLAEGNGMTGRALRRSCGWVAGVAGWADPERRFVLLALDPGVNGDACGVSLSSDTTLLVVLPH